MVAWWLRALTAFNVLCVIAWCVWAWPRSPWLAVAGVVLAMLAGRIWLGVQFLIMRGLKQHMNLPRPGGAEVVRAWNAETTESARQFAWQMPWAEWAEPDHLPADAQGRQGLVLVHGWLCNRAIWTQMAQQLRAQGVPFVAVSLPMLFHRIEVARPVVDEAAQRVRAATGMAPLVIGHSMGGLVVRDWLRSLTREQMDVYGPRQVLTIGTPHHGSPLAYCMMGTNVRQMRPQSEWLRQLEKDEARHASPFSRVRWHCAVSDCDNVVFPEATCQLRGATVHPLPGFAHVQMLRAPALWALVQRLLGATR